MKTENLWQIMVTASAEAEEAVAALLERLFGQRTSVYGADGSPLSFVTVFTSSQRSSKRKALEAGLQHITQCGLDLGPGTISISKVPRQDWTESWKKYFKTLEIGPNLLIKPSWSRRRPKKNQVAVVLDPGLSFGTGQHPTTAFCLKHLADFRKPRESQSLLDLGTGSGILAISAAKLGYGPVQAFDNDPKAVQVAQANARKNRVARGLKIQRRDLYHLKPTRRFDVVCANLMADLLIAHVKKIANFVAPAGLLILAGILAREFSGVQEAYERVGMRLTDVSAEKEWKSGTFAWQNQELRSMVSANLKKN